MITLALGQIGLDTRCHRRLASMLSEARPRSSSSDGAFRLNNAVYDAVRAAHTVALQRGVAFDEAVVATAPPGLAVEERYVFGLLLDQYIEALGAGRFRLDPRSGTTLRRPSASGQFELTGRLDVIVRNDTTNNNTAGTTANNTTNNTAGPELAVHRIQMPAPVRDTRWADAGAAVLLAAARLRIVRIWRGGVDERIVDEADIRQFRDELHDAIDSAQDSPEDTNDGWWCTSCRVALRCPALASDPFEHVLGRITEIQ